jgi:hypothetical protein
LSCLILPLHLIPCLSVWIAIVYGMLTYACAELLRWAPRSP